MKLFENPLYQEDIQSIDRFYFDLTKFENTNILITGATGLIGTIFVDMLNYLNLKNNLNISFFIITRNKEKAKLLFSHINNINFIEQDILKPYDISIKLDYIIHGASNTHPILYSQDPVGSMITNIFGSYNLLNLAKQNPKCKFILLSSVEIYGDDNIGLEKGFAENDFGYLDCNNVRANYSEGKRASESLCQAYKSQYGVEIIILRLCRCYGPTLKKDDSKALSQFIHNALDQKDIILKSEGNQFYSYIYSADAASAIIYCMLNGINGEAYNVSDTKSDIKLKDLAQLIATEVNKNVIFQLPNTIESNGFSKANVAILNSNKINNLGWYPKYTIKEGIHRTMKILGTSLCNL
jgi:nucleoside-diphosphate-sugar epimerase